jgi:nicotinamidase-related amidase
MRKYESIFIIICISFFYKCKINLSTLGGIKVGKLNQNVPLIVIDVQKFFLDPSWGNRNNPDAEQNMEVLIERWRETNRPVIFIQHVSENTKKLGLDFLDQLQPLENEVILQKSVNSAFIGTDLENRLRELNAPNVVIVGLTTNHCVETTTRMAGNMGFSPMLVTDATATFDRIGPDGELYPAEMIHNMTMVNLNEEFATIVTTRDVLEAL